MTQNNPVPECVIAVSWRQGARRAFAARVPSHRSPPRRPAMPISVHEATGTFHLYNNDLSYIFCAGGGLPLPAVLRRARARRGGFLAISSPSAGCPRRWAASAECELVSFEHLSGEYPFVGADDMRPPALDVRTASGCNVLNLVYRGHTVERGKPALEGLPATYVEDPSEGRYAHPHARRRRDGPCRGPRLHRVRARAGHRPQRPHPQHRHGRAHGRDGAERHLLPGRLTALSLWSLPARGRASAMRCARRSAPAPRASTRCAAIRATSSTPSWHSSPRDDRGDGRGVRF